MKKILFHPKVLVCLLLTGALLLVYGQVIYFNFTNIDDQVYVTQNAHIQNGISLNGIAWAFTSSHAANWHPLTSLSLMLDHDFYGLNAGGYHFTNLFFHIINTLLLFFLFNKMTGAAYRSLFIAALFALHPMHVESVTWVSERKDILSMFFWLLTMWAYVLYAVHPGIKRYILVVVLFAMGLMSKPMVVTLPFVLLLLDYWPLNRSISIKNLVIEKIPLLILTMTSSVVTYLVQKQAGAVSTMETIPLDARFYNAIISYVRYIEKALFPLNLSIYYPHSHIWPIWQVILAGSVIVLSSILIWRKSNHYPYLSVGWLWYLGTLVPVIGIVQVGSQAMADRYSYIPFIGLFMMMAWGVNDLVRNWPYKKTFLGFGSVLIILALSFLSWQRCQLWGDNFTLWNDVLEKYNIFSPENVKKDYQIAFAYNFRGLSYTEKGNYLSALKDYDAALKMDSTYVDALNNRANLYGDIGQYEMAFQDFKQAIKFKPLHADTYYNRGLLYNKLGKYDLAILDFSSAIKIYPSMADAFLSRGIAYGSQKKYDKALADFNQALSINQNFYEAYFNRGLIYFIYKSHYDLALADFRAVLRIKPDHGHASHNIRLILEKMEKSKQTEIH